MDEKAILVDIHHLYYPKSIYIRSPIGQKFRNLPPNKKLMPRDDHERLHQKAKPPPVPSQEEMERTVQNYRLTIAQENRQAGLFRQKQVAELKKQGIPRHLWSRYV